MNQHYTNKYGRRFTRGWRPYLLLPKVFCVGIYFGGLVSMLAVDEPGQLHRRVVLPALVGAIIFGTGLIGIHGSILLRMRWLQVKLVVLMAGLVGLHAGYEQTAHLGWVIGLIGVAGLVIILGRHKPRLGQSIATVYQQRQMKDRTS